MKRWFVALTAMTALVLAVSGCADWSEEDVTSFLQELAVAYPYKDPGKPLSESSDKDVQAAAKTPETIEKEHEAENLVKEAIRSKDPVLAENAHQVQPNDIGIWFYQTALFIALGQESDARDSIAAIKGSLEYVHDDPISATYATFVETSLYLDALFATMTGFATESPEWTRLNDAYCQNLTNYLLIAQSYDQEFHTRAAVDRFPAATCP